MPPMSQMAIATSCILSTSGAWHSPNVLTVIGEGLGAYYDHDMTRLEEQRYNDDRRIVSLTDLLNQVENHLLDRINLQELYSVLGTTLRGNQVRPLFFQPNHVVFSAH